MVLNWIFIDWGREMIRRAVIGVFILLISGNVIAGTSGPVQIQSIRVESGIAYIFPKSAVPDKAGCDAGSPISLEPTQAGYKEMYSVALAALTTGKTVQLYNLAGRPSPWGYTIPSAYAVDIIAN